MKDDLSRLIARHSFKGMSAGLLLLHRSGRNRPLPAISPCLQALPLTDDFGGTKVTEVRVGREKDAVSEIKKVHSLLPFIWLDFFFDFSQCEKSSGSQLFVMSQKAQLTVSHSTGCCKFRAN